MKESRAVRWMAVWAIALMMAAPLIVQAQGFYWESRITGGRGGDRTSKTYMMPRIFKIEQGTGKLSAMIVDLDKRLFITVNNEKKTYSETTFDEMEARMKEMGKDADAKMDELREKMKTMPEEQRKMMEKMVGPMGAGGGAPIEVKKTNEKKTILGYTCTKEDVMQGGKNVLSVWATKDVKGFDKLRSDWEEFSRQMSAQMPGRFGKSIAEGMKKIDGFPMETDMGEVTTQVTKLEQRAIPASEFRVPSGYKKVDEPMFEKREREPAH